MSKAISRRQNAELQHYKPEKGLKTIAVAEAAERHFRRAKDATQLMEAVELKLSEQRKFVLWWDGQHRKGGNPTVTGLERLGDLGVDRTTLHRWRVRLGTDEKFETSLEAAQARCVRVCEASKGATEQRGATGTGETEWYTPARYLEAAHEVLGAFDLDPASSDKAQETVKATRYYTKQDDGLSQEWHGRVWLNPPYMQPDIANFVSKLVEECSAGRTKAAILLTHNYTDTAWFHMAVSACSAICFTRGRIAFVGNDGTAAAPTQGQAFFYYGDSRDTFVSRFSDIGFLVIPA